MILSQQAEL